MPCTCDGIRPLLSVKDNARAKFKFRYHDLSLPCKHQTASFTINFFFHFLLFQFMWSKFRYDSVRKRAEIRFVNGHSVTLCRTPLYWQGVPKDPGGLRTSLYRQGVPKDSGGLRTSLYRQGIPKDSGGLRTSLYRQGIPKDSGGLRTPLYGQGGPKDQGGLRTYLYGQGTPKDPGGLSLPLYGKGSLRIQEVSGLLCTDRGPLRP